MSTAVRSGGLDMRAELEQGLVALGLELDDSAIERLLGFVDLLARWNRTYNLTAVRDPREMLGRHIIDSLSIAMHLRGPRILDFGTGAGLPGVPLAIACPQHAFHLLDSNGKKMRFLFQAKSHLALANVALHQVRGEEFHDARGFDEILSRAVAPLAELLRLSAHLLAPGGSLLAMKSTLETSELAAVRAPYTVAECIDLQLPGGAPKRQLVRICSA